MIMRNMSSGATVVVVVVFVGLHVACRGQGLLANIHWDIVDGELQPRVGGLLAQPASHEASVDKEDHVKENQHERMRKEAASQIFDLQVSPSGEGCAAAGELSAGKYGLAISRLGVRCKGCVERADFVDAAQKFLSRVSIRDLKNILALRGAGCRVCRTREHLEMAALHAATLAPKNVTLPLFDAGEGAQHVVCFPRGIAILKVLSPRHRLLIQRALESHQHFALQQHSKLAIVAKILEHTEEREGNLLVKIRCGQRIQVAHTAVEPNSHGLQYLEGSLFVDQPVFRRNSKALDELQKRVRRLFFISDSDACATARADSIGHPPEETHGPEALSHWVSLAISTTNMHSRVAEREMTRMLFRTQNTTRRLVMLDDYLYALYTNSIRTRAAGGNREGNVVGRGGDTAGATEAAAKATAGKVVPAAPQSDPQHDHHEEL